jgi:UDP-glucose 4-epimerase
MKRILITGNSGYIGSHLSKILLTDPNTQIYGLDIVEPKVPVYKQFFLNINNQINLEKEFDCIIHLAAKISVSESVDDPYSYYETNLFGTSNLIKNLKTKHFIFASTGSATLMNNPYSTSKKCAEEVISQLCTSSKIPFTIFRFYNVVGSDGFLPSNKDGVLWNLIQAEKTGIFNLYGTDYNTPDGSAIRDYVHVNEICYSIIKSLNYPTNSIENLGHGIGVSVNQIVELYKTANFSNFTINNMPRRKGDLESNFLKNPSKFMTKLYSLEELFKIKKEN